MEIGDKITVSAYAETQYTDRSWADNGSRVIRYKRCEKVIKRYEFDQKVEAIFLGWSYRATGYYYPGGAEYGEFGSVLGYESPMLEETKRHKVAMFMPIPESGARYLKPICALPEDVEIVNDNQV